MIENHFTGRVKILLFDTFHQISTSGSESIKDLFLNRDSEKMLNLCPDILNSTFSISEKKVFVLKCGELSLEIFTNVESFNKTFAIAASD